MQLEIASEYMLHGFELSALTGKVYFSGAQTGPSRLAYDLLRAGQDLALIFQGLLREQEITHLRKNALFLLSQNNINLFLQDLAMIPIKVLRLILF